MHIKTPAVHKQVFFHCSRALKKVRLNVSSCLSLLSGENFVKNIILSNPLSPLFGMALTDLVIVVSSKGRNFISRVQIFLAYNLDGIFLFFRLGHTTPPFPLLVLLSSIEYPEKKKIISGQFLLLSSPFSYKVVVNKVNWRFFYGIAPFLKTPGRI